MKKVIVVLMVIAAAAFVAVPFFLPDDELLGAGATFPHPLYARMFNAYWRLTDVKITYEGIGSGGGIQQLLKRSVDFGGTDVPVPVEGLAGGPPIVHVPIAVGGVAITYHLPGDPRMRFSRELVADIFRGRVTRWNAAEVARENPSVSLPDLPIIVVYRSEASGTTALFTECLSAASPGFKKEIGSGLSVPWPVGVGAKGNAGVAGLIRNITGSIGFVELAYALTGDLPRALIQNKSGAYVEPTIASTEICADVEIPDDTLIMLGDTDNPDGYPITGFTWIIVFADLADRNMPERKAKELLDLLWWMIHDGQRFAEPLEYAPLPPHVVTKAERIVESITYEGRPLRK